MDEGRYWIALFNEGGEGAGIERELGRDDRLDVARSKYERIVSMYPTRLVMLCERATVLARSDQPSHMWRLRRAYEGHCGRERAFKTQQKDEHSKAGRNLIVAAAANLFQAAERAGAE